MSQQIVTDQRQGASGSYWVAWLSTHPDNYTLGDTEDQAIAYLKQAIQLYRHIYGGE